MKVVVAMDSFKGCLTALQACEAVVNGVLRACPHCDCVMMPVSDGGDGMLGALSFARSETITVTGPLPNMKVLATIGYQDDNTAIIESAQACGLSLLAPAERDPMLTSTVGVGEMIMHVAARGCRRIIIGLGGSATNDLGTGMLSAMGVEFLDTNGEIVEPCGGNIGRICQLRNLDAPARILEGIEMIAACDVNNPLCGPNGAAAVYAPQKGATPRMVQELDEGARSLSRLINGEIASRPGAGAAGGLGYALMSLCNCRYSSGSERVLDLINFEQACSEADIVITGEGSSDRQTLMGKIAHAVMCKAKHAGCPTALLSGQISGKDELLSAGFCSVNAVTPCDMPLDEAMKPVTASDNLARAAMNLIASITRNA